MSVEGKFSGGVAWMAAGNWIEQGINFIVFVLLARLLGAESFGLLALAAAFVLLSEFLVRETFSEFLIARADPDSGDYNAVFWLLGAFGALLFLFLLAFSELLGGLLGEPEIAGLIRALSPTVLMIALTAVPVAILRREMRFAALSLRAIAGVLLGGVVAIAMALNGYGVWSLVAQRLVQVLTNIVMAWLAVSWRPGLTMSKTGIKDVLGFGGTVLGLRAAELAATQVPTVLIGAALGPTVLGFFAVAWRLIEIGSFLIVTPLRMAAQPAFAALNRSGDGAARLLLDISKLSGLIAMGAFAGLFVLSGPVINLVFGTNWFDASSVLGVLTIYGAYLCIEKINQAFCLAAGQVRAITVVAWAEVVLSVVLIWLAVKWGLQAMTVAFVVSVLAFWPVRLIIVSRVAARPVRDLVFIHMGPFFAAVAMAAVVYGATLLMDGYPRLYEVIAGTFSGMAFLLLVTWVFMRDRFDILKRFVLARRHSDGTVL